MSPRDSQATIAASSSWRGTGKTFTSLRLTEDLVPKGGSVLFLVPSIALLGQSLREWSAQRTMPHRYFAICSDTKVGKVEEDYSVSDLSFPATTNTERLVKAIADSQAPDDGITVYFSTYQSIEVVAKAQGAGIPEFDLIVCDEAHRTTGVTLAGDKGESAFVRVHDQSFIKAKKRLYMTATPKIYGDAIKSKARDAAAALISMDDEAEFGPEFHRLGFGEAVERGLLTDYRVLVLAVDEGTVSSTFQQEFASEGELNIPDAARIIGIYNGLAKRGIAGLGEATSDLRPMRRAVAFSRSIKDSKHVASMLDGFSGNALTKTAPAFSTASEDEQAANRLHAGTLTLETRHVDGTMNAMERTGHLDWLKSTDIADDACRILTNARCLSEGVDVPALDAVIFLNSRDSQVDVVQSVGRVMRLAADKDFGYIVLPIAVPAGVEPDKALNDNKKYKVVWDVLRALRAHDERFEAKIEQLDLNRTRDPQVQVIGFGDFNGSRADGTTESVDSPLDFSLLGAEWRDAIYAKIVDKVGERDYWDNWASNVADIATRQEARISQLVLGADARLAGDFATFVKALQDNLNPSVSNEQAIEMLAQHLITQPIFDALFEGHSFSEHNPVSETMQLMIELLQGEDLDAETRALGGFYESVRRSVRGITDSAGRQTTIKRLYEKFFDAAFKSTADRLGIVYTPNEIVNFILRSANVVLRDEFGQSLSDEGVHILDPFTGTGTFIVNLLQSGLIKPEDMLRKFRHELHANEIVLLAYYVAAVNIEATFQELTGAPEPFPGIVLTDTFQSSEEHDQLDESGMFRDNNARVEAQNKLPIAVVLGNPPYSARQRSGNEEHQNLPYPSLDARISETYAATGASQNVNSLYDSYVRAIRWASDRIGDRGIVGFVTNNGYVDRNTFSGLRKTLMQEFSSIYVLNLRGNSMTGGDYAKREGGNVFNIRVGIAVIFLVKNGKKASREILYAQTADFETKAEKYALIRDAQDLFGVSWESLRPNSAGDWINHRAEAFGHFRPLADPKFGQDTILSEMSGGMTTARDAWVYSSSRLTLTQSLKRFLDAYRTSLTRTATTPQDNSGSRTIVTDSARISWSRSLRKALATRRQIQFSPALIAQAVYRPFFRQAVYFSADLIHERSQLPKLFPAATVGNFGMYYVGMGSSVPFSVLMIGDIPDVHVTGAGSGGRFFPRVTYQESSPDQIEFFDSGNGYETVDNVADNSLGDFRVRYGKHTTKDDIFYFTYGLLHSSDYRERYAADLQKMLPRIPNLEHPEDFRSFAKAGRELAALHLEYEAVDKYPVEFEWTDVADPQHPSPDELRVEKKMKYAGKPGSKDMTVLHYNKHLTIRGIPLEAQEYMLGSRSALDWIIDRYYVRTDKKSGIVNDANKWGEEHGNPRYILDLIQSIITVSVKTVEIVNSLPPLRISSEYDVKS